MAFSGPRWQVARRQKREKPRAGPGAFQPPDQSTRGSLSLVRVVWQFSNSIRREISTRCGFRATGGLAHIRENAYAPAFRKAVRHSSWCAGGGAPGNEQQDEGREPDDARAVAVVRVRQRAAHERIGEDRERDRGRKP